MLKFPFASGATAMAIPHGGEVLVFVDQSSPRTDRLLTIRHEVAHALAGDLEGAVFLSDPDYMGPAERIADLFALADAVPGWWVRQVRETVRSWRRTRVEIWEAVADYATGWPPDRLDDRAALRLALYRERGI